MMSCGIAFEIFEHASEFGIILEHAPRLDAPVGNVAVEDLPKAEDLRKETASSRRAALRKLGLLSVKSHFFSRTYCFP
jgi:hypothetical protein